MAKFCGKCGTKLDEETGLCPSCGAEKLIALQKEKEKKVEIVYQKKFCTKCGGPLDENGLCPQCDEEKIRALNQNDEDGEENKVVRKQRFCSKCGFNLDEETGLCPKCDRKKLKDRVEDDQEEIIEEEEEESKRPKVLKIIGMVVGSLVIIAIAVVVIFFLLNNVINKDNDDTTNDNEVVEEVTDEEETTSNVFTINTYDYTLEVGECVDIDMEADGYSYSLVSNDTSVVSFKNNQLCGVGAGETTVIITCEGVEYTLNVTVEGEEDDSDEYILANSSTELLTASDVENLTADELRLARNEIYARHGCYFEDEELQAYFESCSWYEN